MRWQCSIDFNRIDTFQLRFCQINYIFFKAIFMDQQFKTVYLFTLLSALNPLELVKSRYQTMHELIEKGNLKTNYQSLIDCARNVSSHEGFKSLWKGNLISLLRFFPNENINFSVKKSVQSVLPVGAISNIISGICGGLAAATILYPIDTARLFISTSKENQLKVAQQLLHNLKRQGGGYLYRGFGSCLMGVTVFRGSFFGFYDTFKGMGSNLYERWGVAYLSGLLSGFLVYPLETLRKRMIVSNKNSRQVMLLNQIVAKEGVRSLYRGFSVTPLQSLAGSAILLYFDSPQC